MSGVPDFYFRGPADRTKVRKIHCIATDRTRGSPKAQTIVAREGI